MVDLSQLMACTGATQARAEAAMPGINNAMATYDIDTSARVGMFLANVGHETLGLRFLKELGGPEYFRKYEGRLDLGNVRVGDGAKFPGRGMLHTTGRANYVNLRDRLRARGIDCPDFEERPELLVLPEWAALSGADYVAMRELNKHADRGAFVDYCAGVNGRNRRTGLPNGLEERTRLWARAQEVLA